ncbi:hypothetical protein COLO4_35884 [Corchorus olitorius]|uniref:Uncharacterized protein n=1 Tax=Corchorus olitorius TaxID=93759 RepID=A0A1R3GCB5_9ROSI|nr:hypothetical protein COLO4_35884 [Corchorus olitorius]
MRVRGLMLFLLQMGETREKCELADELERFSWWKGKFSN